MFDHRHYVPILRWKQGEQFALRDLYQDLFNNVKSHLTPLIELVPSDFTMEKINKIGGLGKKLKEKAKQMRDYWGFSPFFVDLCNLNHRERSVILKMLSKETRSQYLSMIPVTGIGRSPEYQSAVASVILSDNQGVCIRILTKELQNPTFKNDLKGLLSYLKIHPEQVDLIFDFQVINDFSPKFSKLFKILPEISNCRTFTIASGAFTENLTGFTIGQHHLQRIDWHIWKSQIISSPPLSRLPTYGDYTIQYPIYKEPPLNANVSASIRYTSDDYWVIMRGEGLQNNDGPGFKQYNANAILLCERHEYCGSGFSSGDSYIEERMLNQDKTGSPRTWIQAVINHHLSFVVCQIANLFETSTVVAL